MWQAIKKFRQAYLDAKGNRLHAEAEASRNALCQNAISVEEAQSSLFVEPLDKKVLRVWAETEEQYYKDKWIYNYDDQ